MNTTAGRSFKVKKKLQATPSQQMKEYINYNIAEKKTDDGTIEFIQVPVESRQINNSSALSGRASTKDQTPGQLPLLNKTSDGFAKKKKPVILCHSTEVEETAEECIKSKLKIQARDYKKRRTELEKVKKMMNKPPQIESKRQ